MAKKILLADDEPDIITILKRYLEVDGYNVTTASDGQEAFDKINNDTFDLIILDVMMPKINGWEVCKKIKSDPKTSNIPVIILTAKSQDVDALMSYECGANEYATKPFDFNVISASIKKLLKVQ
ncbi:MAG: response regulator [Endomicrobiales bacterium]|nr:response regulator [Endomicrobiales bacterium]